MSQPLPLDELTLTLARIQGLLLTEEKVDRAVQLLAEGIRDAFPESSGAGVSLMDDQGRRTSRGATDDIVLAADASQYDLGQGPCLTAWATERTVLVKDLATDDRWPLWSQAVAELSIRSIISSPLLAGTRCLGALKIYSTQPGAFDSSTARPLEKLAFPAGTLLNHIQTSETPRQFSEALTSALKSRDAINRAQGYLMHQHGYAPDQALQELVNLSKTSGKSLLIVSSQLLPGTRDTSDDRT